MPKRARAAGAVGRRRRHRAARSRGSAAPSRPSIGKARHTRRANGASSRLASPRWLSASVSTSGTRAATAAAPDRPGDVPAAAHHRRRAAASRRIAARRARPRRPRAPRRAAAFSGLRAAQPLDRDRSQLVAGRGHELAPRRARRPTKTTRGAVSPQRVGDRQRRHDVPRCPARCDHVRLGHRRGIVPIAPPVTARRCDGAPAGDVQQQAHRRPAARRGSSSRRR